MRHLRTGRTLGRRREHRQAMLANLAASLIMNGKVKTTDAKAKEVRPFIERMVTFARRGDLHARRIVLSRLRDTAAVKKLFDEIGPRYTNRNGGYTRILKLGFRQGDNSPVSLIEFVEKEIAEKPAKAAKPQKKQPAKPKTAASKASAPAASAPVQEAAAAEQAVETASAEPETQEPAAGEETEK